jgi:acetyl esterase/lipase
MSIEGPPMYAPRKRRRTTQVYKTVGDCPVRLDVIESETRNSPILVCLHGGALIFGSRSEGSSGGAGQLTELCLDAGFTIVSIDYRLAPETQLPTILEDVRDAWHWVRETLPRTHDVDADRIALLGRSAGGYLALWAACNLMPAPQAVVSLYGYGDILGAWYTQPAAFYVARGPVDPVHPGDGSITSEAVDTPDRLRFYISCRQRGLWVQNVTGLDPVREVASLERFRPICNVSPAYPPTLLVHGTADTDVPFEESVSMHAALQAHGVPSRLISLKDGAHGFDHAVTRHELRTSATPEARALHEVVRFLKEKLDPA